MHAPVRGRFAPSPSGRMHLGNLFSALLAWLSVRAKGGVMVLRMEDLDPDRCREEYALQLADDLRWLGLDWDEGYGAGGPMARTGRGKAPSGMPGPFRRWKRRGWSIPASAPGPSVSRPARPTARTARRSIRGPAGR